MGELDELTGVIDAIYDAGVDPGKWPAAMARMCAFMGSRGCGMPIVDKASQSVTFNLIHDMPEEMLLEYGEYYQTVCPAVEYASVHPDESLFADFNFADKFELDRMEIYDWSRGYDYLWRLSGKVVDTARTNAYVTFPRSTKQEHPQAPELERIKLLIPHLERAAELNLRLGGIELETAASAEVIDRLPAGVIVLDARGEIAFMNAAARGMVAQRDGLDIHGRRLAAARASDAVALRALAASAVAAGAEAGGGGSIAIMRPSGRRPYTVEVFPFRAKGWIFSSEPVTAAIVYVVDPDLALTAQPETLSAIYGLTESESALAAALAAGESLVGYAARAGISIGTARWHLKNAMSKTETHSQADLVRLVLSSVRPIRTPPDRL